MTTVNKIREELKEIRYYMSRKSIFEKSESCVGKNSIENKIALYNQFICDASPRLYDLYVSLYLENTTQETLSDKLGYSLEYISRLNSKLIKFFYQKFTTENVAWWGTMEEIRNSQGKLVCRVDKNSKTVEIVIKGCITTIRFLEENRINITNTKKAV